MSWEIDRLCCWGGQHDYRLIGYVWLGASNSTDTSTGTTQRPKFALYKCARCGDEKQEHFQVATNPVLVN